MNFTTQGRRVGALPGSYKGKRRGWWRRVEKVQAECGFCRWKSKRLPPEDAEDRWRKHMALCHPEGK